MKYWVPTNSEEYYRYKAPYATTVLESTYCKYVPQINAQLAGAVYFAKTRLNEAWIDHSTAVEMLDYYLRTSLRMRYGQCSDTWTENFLLVEQMTLTGK